MYSLITKKNLNNHKFQLTGLVLCSIQDISVIISFVHACLVISDHLGPLLDCRLLCSSVHGIFQASILECIVISSSGDLPDPEIKPSSPGSPELQEDSLSLSISPSLIPLCIMILSTVKKTANNKKDYKTCSK